MWKSPALLEQPVWKGPALLLLELCCAGELVECVVDVQTTPARIQCGTAGNLEALASRSSQPAQKGSCAH
jgi:hypothetical protein